jgi:hypothetical protein
MFFFRFNGTGTIISAALPTTILPPPAIVIQTQSNNLNSIVSQSQSSCFITTVIMNELDKIILIDLQLDEFNQTSSKFLDDSITMDEEILQYRGGGKLDDTSFILPYTGARASYSKSSLDLTNKNNGSHKLTSNQIPTLSIKGTSEKVTAWSAAKHVHHSPDFSLNPRNYKMTQKDLDSIAKDGLIDHIRNGGTPPNALYVKDLQSKWKEFAERTDIDVRDCGTQTVLGQGCHVRKHDLTGLFLAVRLDTNETFTGYQLTPNQSEYHDKKGTIGKNYKN